MGDSTQFHRNEPDQIKQDQSKLGQKPHRLFFALWPTDQVRQSIIDQYTQESSRKYRQVSSPLNGQTMRPNNLHLTLHFLGQVTKQTKARMHQAAQSVQAESFKLNLDCFGHFPKAKIFWIGPRTMPSELTGLHSQLSIALGGCEFNADSRTYCPHLTLLRKCKNPVITQADFSIPWKVTDFALVESIPDAISPKGGVKYQVIEKYPLA